jgi:hypothetical protein
MFRIPPPAFRRRFRPTLSFCIFTPHEWKIGPQSRPQAQENLAHAPPSHVLTAAAPRPGPLQLSTMTAHAASILIYTRPGSPLPRVSTVRAQAPSTATTWVSTARSCGEAVARGPRPAAAVLPRDPQNPTKSLRAFFNSSRSYSAAATSIS